MCCNLSAVYDNFQFKSDPTAYSYANLNQIQSTQGLKNALVLPSFEWACRGLLGSSWMPHTSAFGSFSPSPVVQG